MAKGAKKSLAKGAAGKASAAKAQRTNAGTGKTSSVEQPEKLKGWGEIASFLGQPASVVQRWAGEGLPVRRQGRYVETTPQELNSWLGRESGKPVHVATDSTDLTAELKRGLSFVREEKASTPKKK